jgi:hypothetical protein
VSTAPTTDPAAPQPAYPEHPDWSLPQRIALAAAVVGLAVFAIVGGINLAAADTAQKDAAKAEFFISWTVGFVFWLSLPIGSMALLFIHYLAKTSWGLLLKKLFEAAIRTLPLFVVLFIPIAIAACLGPGLSPFWWANPDETMITDEMREDHKKFEEHQEQEKRYAESGGNPALQPQRLDSKVGSHEMQYRAIKHELEEREHGTFGYLTTAGFLVVGAVHFLIWGLLIYFLNKWGREADDNPANVEATMEKGKNLGGPGLIIYAIVGTSAASQWVMSFEPSWASTMFPVVYSVNQLLCALAFGVAVFMTLVLSGPPIYAKLIRLKFKIDMGSLMLALTLFWSYTSFSQMMLVWIGNLPEEIPYFLRRSGSGWWWVSAFLIFFHFMFPFIVLLFRDVKGHPWRLRAMAIYVLVVCAVDVVWWIEPSARHDGQPLFWVMDVGAIVGIGGLFGLYYVYQLKQRRLLAFNELYMLPEDHGNGHDNHANNAQAHATAHEGASHEHH